MLFVIEALLGIVAGALGALVVLLIGTAYAAGTEILPGIEVTKDAAMAIGIAAAVGRAIPKSTQRKLEGTRYIGWAFTLAFAALHVVGLNFDRLSARKPGAK